MKIYFTFRYLVLGQYIYNPQYVFDNNFTGLPFVYKYICGDINKDGRHLGMVEYNGDIPEEEIRNLLREALASFAYHEKTPEKALEFARYITNLPEDKVYLDENGYIVIEGDQNEL